MSKVIEYDHVAGDQDSNDVPCDKCGESGAEMEVRPCANKACDMMVCCDCRADNEVYAALEACSEDCAVALIADMRRTIEDLLHRNREMAAFFANIQELPTNGDLAIALGQARGMAMAAARWAA